MTHKDLTVSIHHLPVPCQKPESMAINTSQKTMCSVKVTATLGINILIIYRDQKAKLGANSFCIPQPYPP